MRPARRLLSRPNTHKLLQLVLALAVAAHIHVAAADEANDAQARALSTEGLTQFKSGHYDEAIAAFQASYALSPLPPLLFNAAQAYRLQGRCEEALTHYRRYLDAAPEAPNRAAAEARMIEMDRCARADRQAAAGHDEPPVARETPQPQPLPIARVEVPPQQPQPIARVEVPPPQPLPPTRVDKRRPLYKTWWLWTTVGVAVIAGVVAGAVVAGERPTFHATLPGPTTNAALRVSF
jgi:tetratricopeptide (TPR) repeat protein